MLFFETLKKEEREEYIKFLGIMGSLSRFFSENLSPYLDSRICENLFANVFMLKIWLDKIARPMPKKAISVSASKHGWVATYKK